jgi:Ni/Co efflux regulator RcnB
MRRLLISAAILALLAAPALGQPDRGGDEHHGGGQAQPHAAAPGPHPQAGGGRPDNRAQPAPRQNGGGHFDRGGPAAPQQAPQRQPGAGRIDNRTQPAPQAARPDRGNSQDRRGPGNGNFNRPGNRPAGANPANRPGGNASVGGPRHDYRNFRDFHRNFNASRHFTGPAYRRPAGWYDHRWTFGEFLPAAFWARDYWLNDYASYDLPPPPYGATWVRVGNDALLVDEESGEVITVEYGVFY